LARGMGLIMRFMKDNNFGGLPYDTVAWARILGMAGPDTPQPPIPPRPQPDNPDGGPRDDRREDRPGPPGDWGRPFYRPREMYAARGCPCSGCAGEAGRERGRFDGLVRPVNYYQACETERIV